MSFISTQPKAGRLLSLDVFRGITVAAMILVNDPGDWGHIYPPLEHSKWNGCTPTDLVFPFFLFMVGVSIVYAMETKREVVANHGKLILSAFRRMIILMVVIGWGTNLFFHSSLATLRFPGVLPRIALVYFITTILYLKTSQKTRDWLFVILLVGYYLVMNFIPVPGFGRASLEPDKNLGAYIDVMVFTPNHLWAESKTWDPEGLLGTLPAIATCLFGIRLGSWLKRKDRDDNVKVSWMFTFGVLAVLGGLIWNLFFPINKQLWTSSFVLYAGGIATLGLTLCYWLIDVQGYKRFTTFFLPFGANAITAYVMGDFIPYFMGKITIGGKGIYSVFFTPYFSPINASLFSAIFTVLVVWFIMWILYRFKIIIKV